MKNQGRLESLGARRSIPFVKRAFRGLALALIVVACQSCANSSPAASSTSPSSAETQGAWPSGVKLARCVGNVTNLQYHPKTADVYRSDWATVRSVFQEYGAILTGEVYVVVLHGEFQSSLGMPTVGGLGTTPPGPVRLVWIAVPRSELNGDTSSGTFCSGPDDQSGELAGTVDLTALGSKLSLPESLFDTGSPVQTTSLG